MKSKIHKSSTGRGKIRTAKDNAWAQYVSRGKYKTLRKLLGAIHNNTFELYEGIEINPSDPHNKAVIQNRNEKNKRKNA